MTADRAKRSTRPVLTALATLAVVAIASSASLNAQDPPPPQPQPQGQGRARQSPPQPQQKQGLDYFAGVWDFSWSGRETPITPGPRTGKITFTKNAAGNALDAAIDGKVEEGAAYKESGTLTWNETSKELTIAERLASGAELRGTTTWSSPIGFTVEAAPITSQNQTLKVKRTYSILSATSFSILEEVSTNGGPYQRVGTAAFRKTP